MRYVLVFLYLILANSGWAAPADQYPPPPDGIYWGWQGEVLFDFDKAQLSEQYIPLLTRLADSLRRNSNVSVLLTGRTDNTGNLEYNRRLSLKRLYIIRDYLVRQGVELARLHTQNLAEQRPVSIDACEQDRPRNRRVDLAFFPANYPPPYSEIKRGDTKPYEGECEEIEEALRK